jgi:DNA ligase (NAD+)
MSEAGDASNDVTRLEDEIRRHNRLYWDEAKPEIDDYAYDALVRRLRALAPNSPVLQEMGAARPAALGTEFRHREAMLSLDKCYSDEELNKWLTTFEGDVVVLPKFDGIACALHYDERGDLRVAATRGDGQVGDDITQNVRWIEDVPTRLPADLHANAKRGALEVRGEIYMRLSVFEKFKAEGMANPRNLTAGAVKQKDAQKSAGYKLSFAAYDIASDGFASLRDKLEHLRALGFAPIEYQVVDKPAAARVYASYTDRRSSLDYEIDGVVYKVNDLAEQRRLGQTAHHPRFAIAYKFQGDSGTTTLREVEWSVARTGAITPVALVEPVNLSGVTVSRASLHNVAFIDRLGLTLGARVVVVRRGGVIPNVEFVAEPGHGAVPIPERCPACGSVVTRERDFLYCGAKATCPKVVVGRLLHFASTTDMIGFGDVVVEQAFAAGLLKDLPDFFTLTPEALRALPRLGDKTAAKLIAEVDKKRTIPLAVFLRALGISDLGKTVAATLVERYPSLDALLAATEADLASIHGVGETIARNVVQGLAAEQKTLEALRQHITLETQAPRGGQGDAPGGEGPLKGSVFVFTGKLVAMGRSEAEARVLARGGQTASSVTKQVTHVVVGADKSGPKSTKEKAAEKLIAQGAPLVLWSEAQFLGECPN